MFRIVLVHPEIPPNTGNVIRLTANTGCSLHLIEPLGFSMEDKLLIRAGLDYHEWAPVKRHASFHAFLEAEQPDLQRVFAFSTKGRQWHTQVEWQPGDTLLFGSESAGLGAEMLSRFPVEQCVRLPMQAQQRSLNLSNAVSVAVFEAWRQNGFGGAV